MIFTANALFGQVKFDVPANVGWAERLRSIASEPDIHDAIAGAVDEESAAQALDDAVSIPHLTTRIALALGHGGWAAVYLPDNIDPDDARIDMRRMGLDVLGDNGSWAVAVGQLAHTALEQPVAIRLFIDTAKGVVQSQWPD